MFVRNESQIVVQWPESEPLRPGCVIVDAAGEPLADQPTYDPPPIAPAYLIVRNEDTTIVSWPSSEPLRPGCEVVTSAFVDAAATAAVDLDAPIALESAPSVDALALLAIRDARAPVSTSAEASTKFVDVAASAAVDALPVAKGRAKAQSVAPAITAPTESETK